MKDEAESWREVVETLSGAIREAFPGIRASGDRHECAKQTAAAFGREVERLRRDVEIAKSERDVARAECEGVVKDLDREKAKVKKLERTLDAAPRHQDDCDRVQDPSGRAPCNCAVIGRQLRKKVEELECRLVDRGLVCDGNHAHGPCEDPECWHHAKNGTRPVKRVAGVCNAPKWIKAPWEADREPELTRPVVEYSASPEPREGAFWECESCRSKSGSPELCPSCRHNRSLIEKLWNQAQAVKDADLEDLLDNRVADAVTALNAKLTEATERIKRIRARRARNEEAAAAVPTSLQRWLDSYQQCNDGRDLCELPESSAVLRWLATTPPSAVLRALLSARASWVPDGVEILLGFRDDYQRGPDGYMAGCVKEMERAARRDGEMAIVRCAQTLLEMGAVALPSGPAETLRRWVRNQRACTEPDWRKDVLEVLSPTARNVLCVDEIVPLLRAVKMWHDGCGGDCDECEALAAAWCGAPEDWRRRVDG